MRNAIVVGVVISVVVSAGVLGGCSASSDVSRLVGARCESSSECDARCLPPSADYPDGFCTLVCNTSSECPDDAACVDDEGGACLFECTDDASCAFLGAAWQCKDRDRRDGGGKVRVCRG